MVDGQRDGVSAIRVEKRKWDGSVSAIERARLVSTDGTVVWVVPAGSERQHPRTGVVERTAQDEVWAAVPSEWWVLCARVGPDRSVTDYVLHAAAPFEVPAPGVLRWIDLDLDFEVHGSTLAVEDETQFHDHARTMAYPTDVVRGAWSAISEIAARYTTGQWPFDGWIERHLASAS
jgi:protein associated with RNAse G/E